ncbi:hypothetical protein HK097_001896 [Rhizophlyctis rosea]|uniref:Bromodomain-containing protein n=1 Tax=Rhizophlyctis rosea TaxID=64517 RepID=A0AAD5S687_9FUNG|nr:hypothetical protein HK097_001896 [Rhizophlyctis rosea]
MLPANGAPTSPQKRQRDAEQEQEHEDGRPVKRHNGDSLNGLASLYPDAHSDDDAEGSVDGEGDEYGGAAPRQGPADMGLGHAGTSATPAHEDVKPLLPSANSSEGTGIPKHHHKFLQNVLKTIVKNKDATIFKEPVDPVALNIPTYFDIIKRPMDLSTMDRKLQNHQYSSVQQFVDDMNLMLDNCWTFNGKVGPIAQFAYNIQKLFQKQMEKMDKLAPPKEPAPSKKRAPSIEPRELDDPDAPRPKREIHAPARELPNQPGQALSARKNSFKKGDLALKQCSNLLRELTQKRHSSYNWPFLTPVGPEVFGYYEMIKRPMDLSTIRRKLDEGDYDTADQFKEDVVLMFRNCYTFNPVGTDVYEAGKKLEYAFNERWNALPPPPRTPLDTKGSKKSKTPRQKMDYTDDEDDDESDEGEELRLKMEALEKQIIVAKAELDLLATKMEQRRAKKQKRKSLSTASLLHSHNAANMAGKSPASGSKPKTKNPRPKSLGGEKLPKQPRKSAGAGGPSQKKSKPRARDSDDDLPSPIPALTAGQKHELAGLIEKLDESKHAEMIDLLQKAVQPTDGQTEIVLDLETLDKRTAYKLYNFVKRQVNAVPEKHTPARPNKERRQGSDSQGDPQAAAAAKVHRIRIHQPRNQITTKPTPTRPADDSMNIDITNPTPQPGPSGTSNTPITKVSVGTPKVQETIKSSTTKSSATPPNAARAPVTRPVGIAGAKGTPPPGAKGTPPGAGRPRPQPASATDVDPVQATMARMNANKLKHQKEVEAQAKKDREEAKRSAEENAARLVQIYKNDQEDIPLYQATKEEYEISRMEQLSQTSEPPHTHQDRLDLLVPKIDKASKSEERRKFGVEMSRRIRENTAEGWLKEVLGGEEKKSEEVKEEQNGEKDERRDLNGQNGKREGSSEEEGEI